MRGSQWHGFAWKWAKRSLVIASVVPLLVGTALKIPNSDSFHLVAQLLGFFKENASIILLVSFSIALVAQFVEQKFGNPWAWRTVESLLDKLRIQCISDAYLDEPLHRHRVTLFQHRKFRLRPALTRFWAKGEQWRHPWKGWLIPVARSGHTSQKSKTIFCAPDDAELAEGIAGQTWARCGTFEVRDLVLPQLDDPDSIKMYADHSWVSEEYVKAKVKAGAASRLPRSMMGIPIEKRGKAWGVIVVDSVRGDGIEKFDDLDQAIVITQTVISQLTDQL